MTVVMVHAKALTNGVEPKPYIVSPDVVYADDTLLMSSSPVLVQKLLDNVALTGRSYGLELNLDKTVLLRVRGQEYIFGVDGKPLKTKTDTVYLGSLLTTSGEVAPELSRRLGEAAACFKALSAVWKHANIPKKRKYRIFEACVVSKLLYGLESLWLLKAHLRKLDAFGTKCLRSIAGIPPSFFSRVSNKDVLESLKAEPRLLRTHPKTGTYAAELDDPVIDGSSVCTLWRRMLATGTMIVYMSSWLSPNHIVGGMSWHGVCRICMKPMHRLGCGNKCMYSMHCRFLQLIPISGPRTPSEEA